MDIDPDTYNLNPLLLESAITDRTRAIIPVSLYGQPADFSLINEISMGMVCRLLKMAPRFW